MQGRYRSRPFIADLQDRVMMSSVDIEMSADDTSRLVRDVGFRWPAVVTDPTMLL
jgi:hypothetical protein